MRGIPASIDELMWLLSEQDDPGAVEAFERRYPEYRGELLRRMNMVRSLREAKADEGSAIPPYRPVRATPPSGFSPRQAVFGLGSVALAAAVLASWVALRPAPARVEAEESTPQVVAGPTNSPFAARDLQPEPAPPVDPPTATADPAPEPAPVPAPTSAITLRLRDVSLSQALAILNRETQRRFEMAPGLDNPTVEMDYFDEKLEYILADLGNRYGFTAFDQGDGTYLLIPARDPTGRDPNVNVPLPPDGTLPELRR